MFFVGLIWDQSGIILGSFPKITFCVRRRAEKKFPRAPGPGPSRPGMEYPVQGNPHSDIIVLVCVSDGVGVGVHPSLLSADVGP